ncbi:hypothetical protein GH714_013682 [Hevea brasiliensis]|uniref:Dirigent protein n=1 Tax=Hevea brasiliensis TaxID=3981 RepID=A0A6A6KD00_HEVBR|nr:hypothetical protein GH714_013682 [Hevea brasiliensis]
MEGKIFIAGVMILCVVVGHAQEGYYSETIPAVHMEEKMTKLHFFLHDILSGQNPAVVQIAKANLPQNNSFASFGTLSATNDAMRVGVEPTSKLIGRAKGLYVLASQGQDDEMALVMYMDFGFTTGKFNGSSFVVCSRNPVMETQRELAVF